MIIFMEQDVSAAGCSTAGSAGVPTHVTQILPKTPLTPNGRRASVGDVIQTPRELKTEAKAARKAGWELTRTGGGHIKWKPPAGEFIITPSTPSGSRSIYNIRASLRKAGL
jgi:predicted RNA binding protein YcfA (HicA-like mRNA interferase family)